FFQDEIAKSAYDYQLRVESREASVVGVNIFTTDEPPPTIPAPDYSALERDQIARLANVRKTRDAAKVDAALSALRAAAHDQLSLMPAIIDAVRVRASVGEISDTLQREWGRFRDT